MLRPARLRRLTLFLHQKVVDEALKEISGLQVHLEEPELVEPARTKEERGRTRKRLESLRVEAASRGLETPRPSEPGAAGAEPGKAEGEPEPKELGDRELLDRLAAAEVRMELLEAKGRLGRSGRLYVLEGWIPSRRVEDLRELEESVDGLCTWHLEEPALAGDPPTLLDNPDWMGVPEELVRRYGLPSYFELDPTAVIALTFPIIFGFMYGDLGHGAMLMALALLATRFDGLPVGTPHFLFGLAVSSTVFGLLYGEAFGLHPVEPLWFDRLGEPLFLVEVSLSLGILHAVLGMAMAGVNSYSNRRPWRTGLAWSWMVFYALWIPVLFGEPSGLPAVGLAFLLVAAASLRVASLEESSYLEMGLEGVRMLFDSALHVSSYVRVAAVGLTHAVFSALLLGVLGPGPGWTVVWLILTLVLIVGVETFFASIQTLRLHWAEWFYTFYEGRGREFEAFELPFERRRGRR